MRCLLIIIATVALVPLGFTADFSWQAGVVQTKITPEGAYWMGAARLTGELRSWQSPCSTACAKRIIPKNKKVK